MQRKQIKIGEAYAVIASRAQRESRKGTPVKGIVVGFDGEYSYHKSDGWRGRTVTKQDGIVVRFEEPMVRAWDKFEPLAQIEARADRLADHYLAECRATAVTQTVLQAAQMVVEPWADREAREAIWAASTRKHEEKMDAMADEAAAEPILAAIREKLDTLGITPDVKERTVQGVERERTLGAKFTFTHDEVAKLLGIEVTA